MVKSLKPLIFALTFSVVITNLFAQQVTRVTTGSGKTIEVYHSKKQFPVRFRTDSVFPPTEDTTTLKRFIVELKSSPLAKSLKQNTRSRSSEISNEHQEFRGEVERIKKALRSSGKNANATILYEYKNVLNGFVITATEEEEMAIRQLLNVKSVTEDRRVYLLDESTNRIIQADKVWTDLGITGKGIVIAIIDTGIDYYHPDLGGGLGPGKKVIGGYDFVNNDFDPYDDNGHGTHVAGIAAANGSIKGVAPDAQLMGFKVLSADGVGYDSWIVAAIERTVDPDQNPLTDDAVDVVNMSLGRVADVFEPYSSAINYATAYGVTFVVAGGNSHHYNTITTPGISENAITVGSTESNDNTSGFSSKGPVQNKYLIKPDVAAPGSGVYSTFRNSSYSVESGTSMASPHVAGVAALIKEKYPDWTPLQIKSALMNTAKETTEPVWHQGAGRINAEKAILTPFLFSPGSISLGSVSGTDMNTKKVVATVQNVSSQSLDIQLSVAGDLFISGVTTSIQPATVTLNPGEAKEILISFQIDPLAVPAKKFSNGHFGTVKAISGIHEVHVPVALVNDVETVVNLSTPLPDAIFISNAGDNSYYDWMVPTSEKQPINLPAGKFDFLAVYLHSKNSLVLAEEVNSNISNNIDLREERAVHHIRFDFMDREQNLLSETNDPILPDEFSGFFFMRGMGININDWKSPGVDNRSYYISDNTYAKFDVLMMARRGGILYNIALGSPMGISESTDFVNDPSAFTKIEIANPGQEYYDVKFFSHCQNAYFPFSPMVSSNHKKWPLVNTSIFYAQQKEYARFSSLALLEPSFNDTAPKWSSGFISVRENDILEITDGNLVPKVLQTYNTTDFRMELGASLLQCAATINHLSNSFSIENISFDFNSGEKRDGKILMDYRLASMTTGIGSRTFQNNIPLYTSDHLNSFTLPKDAYTFTLNYSDYQLHKKNGNAVYEMLFDTRKDDKTPPVISALWLESGNSNTNYVIQGGSGKLFFSASDCPAGKSCSGIAETQLIISGEKISDLSLPVTNMDNVYSVIVPDTLSNGYYNLKLILKDGSGNAVSYSLNPGFVIGTPPADFSKVFLKSPSNHYEFASHAPLFSFTISPGAVAYKLQIAKTPDFASNEEIILNEPEFLYAGKLESGTQYYWRVKPQFPDSEGAWSAVFDFITRGDEKVNLLLPSDGSVINDSSVLMLWDRFAHYFELQVSLLPGFDTYQVYYPHATTFEYELLPNTKYYWRVRSLYQNDFSSWDPGPYSDVFSFTTDREISLLSPSDNASSVSFGQVVFNWIQQIDVNSYTVYVSERPDFSGSIVKVTENTFVPFSNFLSGATYYWKAEGNLKDGRKLYSPVFKFTTEIVTGILYPENSQRSNAYPIPSSGETWITYTDHKPGPVFIEISDVHGRSLFKTEMVQGDGGTKTYLWKTTTVPDGVYLCHLYSDTGSEILKLLVRH